MRWSRLAMGFCPQFRSGRRLYAQETTGALLAGLFFGSSRKSVERGLDF